MWCMNTFWISFAANFSTNYAAFQSLMIHLPVSNLVLVRRKRFNDRSSNFDSWDLLLFRAYSLFFLELLMRILWFLDIKGTILKNVAILGFLFQKNLGMILTRKIYRILRTKNKRTWLLHSLVFFIFFSIPVRK